MQVYGRTSKYMPYIIYHILFTIYHIIHTNIHISVPYKKPSRLCIRSLDHGSHGFFSSKALEASASSSKLQELDRLLRPGSPQLGFSLISQVFLRRTPHPLIVTIRDNKDYIRALFCSYYTTITGWGVLLRCSFPMRFL